MRISWDLLSTLVDLDGRSPADVAAVLTSTGLEVESMQAVGLVKGALDGVVVGNVLTCAKHPDADRLSVCMVDIGQDKPSQIVCGAPNVAAGQKVLVATVGAVLPLPDGTRITIKRTKIRGVESNGMICAEDELGLGEDHDGILVLDPSAVVGTPASDHLGLKGDHVFEIGLTPNRADAMGHWGVARDLAAAVRYRTRAAMPLHLPDVQAFRADDHALTVPVQVDAPHACPRYAGLTLTEVRVGPSPAWLQDRLKSLGLKPINNVVDVTNFVQHELGQPLHAFDADKLRGGRIIVRQAKEGERFTTLDGKERTLSSEDLLIADAEEGACLAGVFGGAHSGVSGSTTRVFLESACFEPIIIRRMARRHGLNTDASFRFERGVDPEATVYALKRAALLLKEVAGARISSEVTDLHPHPRPWKEVRLHFATLERLCGMPIAADDVVRILELLDCRIAERTAHGLLVQVPPYRVDVHREADLVEEVLRIHGFDQVPLPERLMCPPVHQPEVTAEGFQRQLAGHLAARGFREVMTPSLVNGGQAVKLGAAAEDHLIRLKNPLSAELDVLRPTLLFGMLAATAHNQARQQRDLRFFERGRIYGRTKDGTQEHERIGLLLTGRRRREQWRTDDTRVDAADLREEVTAFAERAGLLAGLSTVPAEHPLLEAAVELRRQGVLFAVMGAVRQDVLKAFGIDQPVLYAELVETAFLEALRAQRTTFAEVGRFPAVRRDLSLLLDHGVTYAQLEALAFKAERTLLRSVGLFDVYEGDKLPQGRKSYALSFVFQDPAKTLTDDQVEKAMGRIRKALEQEAGAELRG